MTMGKQSLQTTCRFGKEKAGEILLQSFALYLRRELAHDR